jgi:hypothetical protein
MKTRRHKPKKNSAWHMFTMKDPTEEKKVEFVDYLQTLRDRRMNVGYNRRGWCDKYVNGTKE